MCIYTEERYLKMEVEIEPMQLKAKDHQALLAPLETRKRQEKIGLRVSERARSCRLLDFRLLAGRTVRQ